MPSAIVNQLVERVRRLQEQMDKHLEESVDVHKSIQNLNTNLWWIIKINIGIFTLVLGKMLADWFILK